jgi:hypothetical protein
MKGFILIGLAVLIVLLAGYGGVVSIDKAMGDSPLYTQKKSVNDQMLHSGGADDSETLECSQKDVENVDPLISKGAEKVRFGGVDFISSLESGLIEADSKSTLTKRSSPRSRAPSSLFPLMLMSRERFREVSMFGGLQPWSSWMGIWKLGE